MRAYVFVDDSNDEQAPTPHKTGTGEHCVLSFLARHLGPVHSRQTPFGVT
jgi:hypothetical protein